MSQSQALAILTQEEAVAKLLASGYTREPCADCKGAGHHIITSENVDERRSFMCTRCDGHGKVWRAPLTR